MDCKPFRDLLFWMNERYARMRQLRPSPPIHKLAFHGIPDTKSLCARERPDHGFGYDNMVEFIKAHRDWENGGGITKQNINKT